MMSTTRDAIDDARASAQELHKTLAAGTAADHADIKADVKIAGERADALAKSLGSIEAAQGADAKQHVANAVSKLEEVSKDGKAIGTASVTDLKGSAQSALKKIDDALHSLSQAVAAKRLAPAGAKK